MGHDQRDLNDGRTRSERTPLVSIRGKAVPFPLSVILWIPMVGAFLIAGPLSIPVTIISRATKRRKERKFATEMRAANRLVSWPEDRSRVEGGHGCLISDHLSLKGPVRLWWTSDDVPAVSPYPYLLEESPDFLESPNSEFDAWCRASYTNPQSGAAQLVELRDVDRSRIDHSLTEFRRQHRHVELWPQLRPDVTLSTAE